MPTQDDIYYLTVFAPFILFLITYASGQKNLRAWMVAAMWVFTLERVADYPAMWVIGMLLYIVSTIAGGLMEVAE